MSMTDETNNGIDGYSQTRVGDHTILTPKDKKASVYQKVTPREQYAVARDVANRAINEINAIRGDRPSSFTGGINDSNIAARMQAAETYGDTLPSRRSEASPTFSPTIGPGSAVGVIGSIFKGLREGPPPPSRNLIDADRVRATAPQISEIKGDYGYGPSIRYPEPDTQVTPTPTPTPTDPDPTPVDPTPTPTSTTPWYKERRGVAGDYNQTLRGQGFSGTHWSGPRDDGPVTDSGSFARTNFLTDQFRNFAGDDNNLSYDEFVQGIFSYPEGDKWAYGSDLTSNALADYWSSSGATLDPRVLERGNLAVQNDRLIQKLNYGDVGPHLAYKDRVDFLNSEDDGDDDGYNYFSWSRQQ